MIFRDIDCLLKPRLGMSKRSALFARAGLAAKLILESDLQPGRSLRPDQFAHKLGGAPIANSPGLARNCGLAGLATGLPTSPGQILAFRSTC